MTRSARRFLAATTAFALLLPTTAGAQNALTLDEALRLSLERQPALEAYNRTAQAFEEAAVAARQLPDPRLMAGVQNLPVTGPDAFSPSADFMTMRFIGIGREQVREARREAESARLRAEGTATLVEQQLLARRIQREVMLAWIQILEARQGVELLEQLIERLGARLRTAEAGIPTGQAMAADAIAIRAEMASARAELELRRGQEQEGRAALGRWIGDAGPRPLSGALPICRPLDERTALPLLGRHPQLELSQSRTIVADRATDAARAERQPNWGWSVMYGNRGGGRSDMLSLQLSVDLPINRGRLQNRRIAEASELAAAARDRVEDMRRQLVFEYDRALAQWRAAEARYRTTGGETLPALIGAERALEARLAGGTGDLQAIQVASERTTRASLDLVEQRASLARASADLLYLQGECAE